MASRKKSARKRERKSAFMKALMNVGTGKAKGKSVYTVIGYTKTGKPIYKK